MKEIEFIKSVQVLKIRENDILVIKVDRRLSEELVRRIRNTVLDNLPESLKNKIKIFILEPGVDLG